jgi:hypothetical protein
MTWHEREIRFATLLVHLVFRLRFRVFLRPLYIVNDSVVH